MISGVIIAVTLVLTLVLRVRLARENHRRANMPPEVHQREAAIKEPCDRVGSILFCESDMAMGHHFLCSIPIFDTSCETKCYLRLNRIVLHLLFQKHYTTKTRTMSNFCKYYKHLTFSPYVNGLRRSVRKMQSIA